MKVGFISLGCNKNLVDTEKTIALFQKHKYEIINNPEEAEIIVINTCGFIEAAKEEAINTILEMAEYKKINCKYLIVMGCLAKRYKKELEKAIPEVDLYIPYGSYDTLWKQIEELIEPSKKVLEKEEPFEELIERVITTGANYAYLKIADGCSNCCTYCAIPKIRGILKSRKMETILQEAEVLAQKGYHEIILTAQDTTKYGIDIYGKPMLAELLEKLCQIEKIKWIRFLYAYPETITDKLIDVIKKNPKICHYFDIPIQHISNNVLKKMNRQSDNESIRILIQKLRKELPDVILRTTVMVGFPGETKKDFEELYHFVEETKFDKLGAFSYSKEEGTAAYSLPEQVHTSTKKSRYHKIMELQKRISKENLENKIGTKVKVMIEGEAQKGKYYFGRSYMDAPEIDGVIYIRNNQELKPGQFVNCEITNVTEYDLIGRII